MSEPEAFEIRIPDADLKDLARRLRATRWPDREVVKDWSQGVPLAYVQDLVTYWAERYDWRSREARINEFPQFRLKLNGLGIHFIHLRSSEPSAVPLLMTHGWPGSIIEFLKVLRPLANPREHGGSANDAFHIVCPSLPGYGFSDKPTDPGFGVPKIAELWDELMLALGYKKYFAQGGDWGAAVTTAIALQNRGRCQAIHLNMPITQPTPEALKDPTPAEKAVLDSRKRYLADETGYSSQQSTRPQTLGYGLADSPAGQAAWIMEKFYAWTDCGGHPENALTRDELLDNIMLYWLSNSGASSARLYWESFRDSLGNAAPVRLPTGCSIHQYEVSKPPRSWVERRYQKLMYWNEVSKGGHFAAFEQPELFVREVRDCFRSLR
ncbi:MAG: epoxide hydrolase [Vicinamibacterales bacterium]